MSEPRQITDIYKFQGMYAKNLDFECQEYRVCWQGDWQNPPDLTDFPTVPNATITTIPHSYQADEVWINSTVLRYGSDSHIRLLNSTEDEQFPICKVAIDDHQRRLIKDEYAILCDLGSRGAPVVRVHSQPLTDESGIFGFRMERPSPVLNIKIDRTQAIERLQQIHKRQIVHNDFHPGNVMMNRKGNLLVIDFGRSGRVGDDIPHAKRCPWRQEESYSFEADYIGLDKFFEICS